MLDRFGREMERERVRPAMGFRPQMLKADEPETITGVPAGGDRSEWTEDGHWQSGRWKVKSRALAEK